MLKKQALYFIFYCLMFLIGLVLFAYLLDANWEGKRFLKFLGILASGVVMIFAKEKVHKKYEMLKRK